MEKKIQEELTSRLEIFVKNTDEHHGDYFRKFKSEIKSFQRKFKENHLDDDIFTTILEQISQYPPTKDKKDLITLCEHAIEQLSDKAQNKHNLTKEIGKERMVFVVHGRNNEARRSMFDFIRAIDLHPLEWSEIVKMTKIPTPYIGEVLETAFENVQATIVLFTGDDKVKLQKKFIRQNDPEFEKKYTLQARPNVLFEAGWAMGKFPERTIIVELGKLKPFTDISGRYVVRLNNTPEKRKDVISRLKLAGCAVNDSGSDWLSAGDFDSTIV